MSYTASFTGTRQAEAHLQALTAVIGPVGPKSHAAVDALDWLMHEVGVRAPRLPLRAEESDNEWNVIKVSHESALKDFMAKVDLVVDKVSTLYPLTGGIFKTVKRYAEQVATSTAIRDERKITTCKLCNQDVNLTDMRRQCNESNRFVVIHSHCPSDKNTRLRQILQNNGIARLNANMPAPVLAKRAGQAVRLQP